MVHWRRNVFEVPRGSAGKAFVCELARLFRAVGQGSALESIALKAVFVACSILLQRTSRSKPVDNGRILGERMVLWRNGDLLGLLHEGKTIQARLKSGWGHQSSDHSSRHTTILLLIPQLIQLEMSLSLSILLHSLYM